MIPASAVTAPTSASTVLRGIACLALVSLDPQLAAWAPILRECAPKTANAVTRKWGTSAKAAPAAPRPGDTVAVPTAVAVTTRPATLAIKDVARAPRNLVSMETPMGAADPRRTLDLELPALAGSCKVRSRLPLGAARWRVRNATPTPTAATPPLEIAMAAPVHAPVIRIRDEVHTGTASACIGMISSLFPRRHHLNMLPRPRT